MGTQRAIGVATGSRWLDCLYGRRDPASRDYVGLHGSATLTYRYGQTNCFVGPTLKYGIFEASDTEIFLVTSRSARNMAYQGIFDRARGECKSLATFTGADILGTKVAPPFGVAKEVYVLPMDGVLATKVCCQCITPADF